MHEATYRLTNEGKCVAKKIDKAIDLLKKAKVVCERNANQEDGERFTSQLYEAAIVLLIDAGINNSESLASIVGFYEPQGYEIVGTYEDKLLKRYLLEADKKEG